MNPTLPPPGANPHHVPHTIPHYAGPRLTPPSAPRFSGRALVGTLVAGALVAAGAAVLVAQPWSAGHGGSDRLVLHHGAVEGGLFDDGAPRCNGGADIPAVAGRRFVCTSSTTVYVVKVSDVDAAERRVGWEVVSERPR